MPKKRATRLYWKRDRAYADFRDYASVGGRLEPLIPAGQHFATKDPDVAAILIASRLKELDALRRGLGIGGAYPATYPTGAESVGPAGNDVTATSKCWQLTNFRRLR